MKKIRRITAFILALCLTLFGITACSTEEEEAVEIIYANWAEGVAMTNLAKLILEEDMGYNVEITMADVGVIFASLAEGDTDLYLDAWLPLTQKNYMEKYGKNIDKLGTNFEGARIGIAVPSYMDHVNSVYDLEEYADEFNGEIIGIDSGAEMMTTTKTLMEEYGLDSYKLVSGSEPAMTASVKSAVESDEAIAFLAWKPHWKFARWDLKFLEEPKNMYGEEENIYSLSRTGFKEDMPEIAEFIENFKFTEKEIGSLMDKFENGADNEASAREWVEENRDLVESWLPKD